MVNINENSPILPWEIVDQILIWLNSSTLAIELERICILKWLSDRKPPTKWAVENNHLDYLKYLHQFGKVKTTWTISNPLVKATSNNYFQLLKFWHENIESLCSFPYIDYASSAGHLDLVYYLDSIKVPATTDAMDRAACRGHLEIIQYLNFHRDEGCTSRALNGSVKNGHLRVVKFLVEVRDEKITGKTLQYARGQRAVYNYLVSKSIITLD